MPDTDRDDRQRDQPDGREVDQRGLVDLVRGGHARSRPELARLSGMGRGAVTQRVAEVRGAVAVGVDRVALAAVIALVERQGDWRDATTLPRATRWLTREERAGVGAGRYSLDGPCIRPQYLR